MAEKLVKGVGAMIGLATEAHAARRTSKAARAAADNDNAAGSNSRSMTPLPTTSTSQRRRPSPAKHTGSEDFATHNETEHEEKGVATYFKIPDQPPPYSESALEGHAGEKDEADWELDDAVEDEEEKTLDKQSSDASSTFDPGPVPSSKEGRQHYVDRIVQAFLARHPVPDPGSTVPTGQLPCPVIIPQRRPHDKKRGFVRAYAPVLQSCGVDQDSFLAFLKAMHQSSKASPVFNVINMAAMAAGFAPSVTAMIVSTVVQAAAMAAIEVQGNLRTNDFLAQLNDKYFRPRGLFCLIFKYKPEDDAPHEAVDLSSTILKSITPSPSRLQQTIANAGRASGRTIGELEMPHAAPLIFPALSDLHAHDPPATKKDTLKRKGKFVATYFDKRAQASYTAENPTSVLATANTQRHAFASRYADPTHPVNSGSPIALLTGGIINPKARERPAHHQQQQSGLGGILAGRRDARHHGKGSAGGLGGGPLGLVGSLASMAVSRSRSSPSAWNASPAAPHGPSSPPPPSTSSPHPAAPHGPSPPPPHTPSSSTHDDTTNTESVQNWNQASSPRQKETDREDLARVLEFRDRDARREAARQPNRSAPSSQSAGRGGLLKRVLNPNVLYLMVVNMPSEVEMGEARAVLAGGRPA